MARQHGISNFTGKLGGLSFYKRGNGYFVRMPGGGSREKIKTSASCARIRESNQEFAGACAVAKVLRQSLPKQLLDLRDRYFSARLNGVFKKMCALGDGLRGKRAIRTSLHGELLKGFPLNKERPLSSVFKAPIYFTCSPDRNSVTATLPAFLPKNYIKHPKGATHFQLMMCVTALSDYEMVDGAYSPVVANLDGVRAMVESELLGLDGSVDSLALGVDVFDGIVPANVGLVVTVGVIFFQRVGGVDYGVSGGGVGVVDII